MNIVLWCLQVLAAAAFLMSGLTKVSQPKSKLATTMSWVEDFSPGVVKLIGTLEILVAVGLIVSVRRLAGSVSSELFRHRVTSADSSSSTMMATSTSRVNLGSTRADTASPPTRAQRLPEQLRSSAARRMAAISVFMRTARKGVLPRRRRSRRAG